MSVTASFLYDAVQSLLRIHGDRFVVTGEQSNAFIEALGAAEEEWLKLNPVRPSALPPEAKSE